MLPIVELFLVNIAFNNAGFAAYSSIHALKTGVWLILGLINLPLLIYPENRLEGGGKLAEIPVICFTKKKYLKTII